MRCYYLDIDDPDWEPDWTCANDINYLRSMYLIYGRGVTGKTTRENEKWQEKHIGKRCLDDWTVDDFKSALDMIEDYYIRIPPGIQHEFRRYIKSMVEQSGIGGSVMERVDKETWDKLNKLIGEFYPPGLETEKHAEAICRLLGKESPEESPFPDVSPGDWYEGSGASQGYIYNSIGNDAVAKMYTMNRHFAANSRLICAAKDLMTAGYALCRDVEDYASMSILTDFKEALRKAGVKL